MKIRVPTLCKLQKRKGWPPAKLGDYAWSPVVSVLKLGFSVARAQPGMAVPQGESNDLKLDPGSTKPS